MMTTNRRDSRPRPSSRLIGLLAVTAACALAACTGDDAATESPQTGFPGQVTAGGKTSGEVLARSSQQGGTDAAEGTPGIPGGSGGNTGGTQMGGSNGAPNAGGGDAKPKAEADKAAQEKKAAAEREKQQLAAAMDRVAAHWRERAATDPSLHAGTPASGVKEGLADEVPRSEKHGTAAPSEDVKQPTPDDAGATVPSDAYKDGK